MRSTIKEHQKYDEVARNSYRYHIKPRRQARFAQCRIQFRKPRISTPSFLSISSRCNNPWHVGGKRSNEIVDISKGRKQNDDNNNYEPKKRTRRRKKKDRTTRLMTTTRLIRSEDDLGWNRIGSNARERDFRHYLPRWVCIPRSRKNVLERMRMHPTTSFSWETGTTEASNKETEYVLPNKGNGPEFVRGTLFGNGMISEFCCIHSFSFIAVSKSLFFCRERIKGFGFQIREGKAQKQRCIVPQHGKNSSSKKNTAWISQTARTDGREKKYRLVVSTSSYLFLSRGPKVQMWKKQNNNLISTF